MKIAFAGASATGKSTLARYIAETFNLPINPVGSRSIAKEMGFVGPGPAHEGRPYLVDQACSVCYDCAPSARCGFPSTRETFTRAEYALMCEGRHLSRSPTVRSLFQTKLQAAKIAWETRAAENAACVEQNDVRSWEASHIPGVPGSATLTSKPLPTGFVTDRTPLDDLAYSLLHCPSIVDAAFRDRAYEHTSTYDVIYYCPLSAGQWLSDDDPARVTDPLYHWHYDVLLEGLLCGSHAQTVEITESDLDARKAHVVASIDAIKQRRAR